jgi:hypothetical protein
MHITQLFFTRPTAVGQHGLNDNTDRNVWGRLSSLPLLAIGQRQAGKPALQRTAPVSENVADGSS